MNPAIIFSVLLIAFSIEISSVKNNQNNSSQTIQQQSEEAPKTRHETPKNAIGN